MRSSASANSRGRSNPIKNVANLILVGMLCLSSLGCMSKKSYIEHAVLVSGGLNLYEDKIDIVVRRNTFAMSPSIAPIFGWTSPTGSPTSEELAVLHLCEVISPVIANRLASNGTRCRNDLDPFVNYRAAIGAQSGFTVQAWPMPDPGIWGAAPPTSAEHIIILDQVVLAASRDERIENEMGVQVAYGPLTLSTKRKRSNEARLQLIMYARYVVWNVRDRRVEANGRTESSVSVPMSQRWHGLYWLVQHLGVQIVAYRGSKSREHTGDVNLSSDRFVYDNYTYGR